MYRRRKAEVAPAVAQKAERICEFELPTDEINTGLNMAGDLDLIQLVLQKRSSIESRVEGVLQKFNSLESSVQGIEGEIATLTVKTSAVEKSVGETDNSLKFLNKEIEGLKAKVNEKEREIKLLNYRILYQDVYSRRENLRFFGIPESTKAAEENAQELTYRYIKREIEVDNARDIEFQRCIEWDSRNYDLHDRSFPDSCFSPIGSVRSDELWMWKMREM